MKINNSISRRSDAPQLMLLFVAIVQD